MCIEAMKPKSPFYTFRSSLCVEPFFLKKYSTKKVQFVCQSLPGRIARSRAQASQARAHRAGAVTPGENVLPFYLSLYFLLFLPTPHELRPIFDNYHDLITLEALFFLSSIGGELVIELKLL